MDKPDLTPLFSPALIVVFAGDPDEPASQTAYARAVRAELKTSGFAGALTFRDIRMTGTLADLVQVRADLAVIALPHAQIADALEIAGRIRCRAALVLSSGLPAAACEKLLAIAKCHGMHLLGPNSLGLQRPHLKLNASAAGATATPGPLALVSQSAALTSSIIDWAQRNGVGFSAVISLGPNTAVTLPQALDFLANNGATQSIPVYMEGMQMLAEWRGMPAAHLEAVEQILLRVSEMVCELPQLREMDINPLIVDETGAVAVDARVVIAHAATPSGSGRANGPTAQRPNGDYQHLAILPYPSAYQREWPMKGGDLYTIRPIAPIAPITPITPDDADMLQAFVRGLAPESRYFRFASSMPELPARILARYTLIDYDREMALVAVHTRREAQGDGAFVDTEQIIGVSRYITNPDQTSAEYSLVVTDAYIGQGQGLGSRLMLSIMEFARAQGLTQIDGLVLAHNPNRLRLMTGLGFKVHPFPEDPDFRLVSKAL